MANRNLMIRTLCVVALSAAASAARADRWEVVAGEDVEVVFHSKATLESFDGKSNQVEGWVEFDPESPELGIEWSVSVDLRTLDTGIGLRNRHMRENHLHTDEFPVAMFRGGQVGDDAPARLAEGTAVVVTLEGEFELHGVIRTRSIAVTMTLLPDGSLDLRADFGVSLAEHDIPRPGFLMMKLADLQQVELRARARIAGKDES